MIAKVLMRNDHCACKHGNANLLHNYSGMKYSTVIFLILIIGSLAATEEQQIEAVQGLVSRVLGKVLVFTSSEFEAIRG